MKAFFNRLWLPRAPWLDSRKGFPLTTSARVRAAVQPARRKKAQAFRSYPNPSALMRSPHHLEGVFNVTPFSGFFGVALALAGERILRRLRDRSQTMLFKHLSRDGVNLHFGYHVALLMFCHSEPQRTAKLLCNCVQTPMWALSFL
jgi:hypothetical protein